MGWHSMSQPGREYLCKITELGFFAVDFLLGHMILFVMLPAILVPQIDKLHSIMLFWLRPSRQIRPPIYSLKQSKLRRRRVIRYSILFFAMFVLFIALLVGPIVAAPYVANLSKQIPFHLYQPTGQNINDTRNATMTGTGALGAAASTTGALATGAARLVKLY